MKRANAFVTRLAFILWTATVPLGCGDDSSSNPRSSTADTETPEPSLTHTPTATATPVSPTETLSPSPTMVEPTSTEAVPTQKDTPTLAPTATPSAIPKAAVCGNAEIEPGEGCDDGGICIGGDRDSEACSDSSGCRNGKCRPMGGDGCAFNCTMERLRSTRLGFSSDVVVQFFFSVAAPLSGTQAFRTGKPREVEVFGVDGGVLARAGEYPITVRASDVVFDPFHITGFLCACIKAVDVPSFGPGNSGIGVIGCGPQGLSDINYELVQDHNTTPGDPRNGNTCAPPRGPQLPDDPDCRHSFEFPSGVISRACREGTEPPCDDADEIDQPGVCNSPRQLERGGGQAVPGSALIQSSIAIGLLNDSGLCRTDLPPGDPSCPEDYGPDCQPCTDDDLDLGDAENIPMTTGIASAALFDAVGQKGRTIGVGSGLPCSVAAQCESGEQCVRQCEVSGRACPTGEECASGDSCGEPRCDVTGCGGSIYLDRCITMAQGTPFDCTALADDLAPDDGDGDGLSGAALAAAFPTIDAPRIGDNVTTLDLVFE